MTVSNNINQRTDGPAMPWSAKNQTVATSVPAAAGEARP